ncbi:uncharacterized protein SPPG_06169 [Spizellomyces punctatus DAOM BR117]|uniref:HECT-type E3 ubiquitin transferase n=1 Tax=Spizellomyces punctatus (strain DAOM BR117) TaxID=645134 RepID=A0A0L0HCH4_SPIPD|nr:uncharacterized protein SPPG_06169 [Spizellomyces punctatus DAOM BR117]KNC98468.1 hypothetical protein SPPG_06169 [Spizellomyces punctatus DAOM BR117]|eukprot:XP_016606508.1 hypothetical protein SPPG_06169 [Spizellomyces punctatus DAOM BR117]
MDSTDKLNLKVEQDPVATVSGNRRSARIQTSSNSSVTYPPQSTQQRSPRKRKSSEPNIGSLSGSLESTVDWTRENNPASGPSSRRSSRLSSRTSSVSRETKSLSAASSRKGKGKAAGNTSKIGTSQSSTSKRVKNVPQASVQPPDATKKSSKKRRRPSISSDEKESEDNPTPQEHVTKRRRHAAVRASETITSISSSGKKGSSTLEKVDMGKDKSKSKGKLKEGDDLQVGQHEVQAPQSERKKSNTTKEKSKGRRGKKNDESAAEASSGSKGSRGSEHDLAEDTAPTVKASRKKRGRTQKSTSPDLSSSASHTEEPGRSDDHYHESDDPSYDDDDDMDADFGRDDVSGPTVHRSNLSTLFGFGGGISIGGSGAMGGSSRFSSMLRQLKQKNDPTMQMVALQELSEVLSMATEDMFIGNGSHNLAGFNTNEFVKALVDILKGPADMGGAFGADFPLEVLDELGMSASELGFGGGMGPNPELMLLACRCLSNLIEAHPSSTMHVLQHGAVQVLVGKLMEVEYIDLAEQVLSVLGKISQEYPSAVVRANGLLAVLQYIDFFSLHVQRTALTIAANACRGLNSVSMGGGITSRIMGGDSSASSANSDTGPQTVEQVFGMVKEVMPILERLLVYSDQKLVEQAVRCLGRIVDWCWKYEDKLENLVTPSLLKTVIGLINPTGTASSGPVASNPHMFTQLVKLVANVSKGSARLGTALIEEYGIVEVIKNYLTGGFVGSSSEQDADTDMETVATAVTNVVVNRPVEQVLEVLNLALAVVPSLPRDGMWNTTIIKDETLVEGQPNSDSPTKRIGSIFSRGRSRSPEKNSTSRDPMDIDQRESGSVKDVSSPAARTSSDSAESAMTESPTQNKKPALDERDARRLELLRRQPEAMQKYASQLLPIMIEVFGATVNANLRRKVVECVAKGIWYLDQPEFLAHALAKNQVFGKFVSELLSLREIAFRKSVPDKERKEALVLVAGGVQIALVVMNRCGEKFKAWFAREGTMEELVKIVAMNDLEKEKEVEKKDESPVQSPVRTETPSTHLPTPMGRRLSDLVKDLKRLRDQVAGHIGTSSTGTASSEASSSAVGPAADKHSEVEELLETVEALAKGSGEGTGMDERGDTTQKSHSSSSLRIDTGRKDSTSTAGGDAEAASEMSESGASVASPTSPGSSLLHGMRSMLERLGRGSHSTTSASRRQISTAGSVIGLNGERVAETEMRSWIVAECKSILEVCPATPMSSEKAGLVLEDLRRLGAILRGHATVDGDDPLMLSVLHAIAEHFAGRKDTDTEVGVTGYEMLESGVMDAMADFLTKPGIPDVAAPDPDAEKPRYTLPLTARLKAFLHVFMNGPTPDPQNRPFFVQGAFKRLVQRLQESLSRVERFEVAAAVPSSTGFSYEPIFGSMFGASGGHLREASNPSMQLTRQLKVKLMAAEPDTVPRQYQALLISVHAVATYKALEDYLKGRVAMAPQPTATRGATEATKDGQEVGAEVSENTPETPSRTVDEQGDIEMGDAAITSADAQVSAGDDEADIEDEDMEDEFDDDDDDDLDDDMLNVSDLLLHSEEARRRRRRGESFTSQASAVSDGHSEDTANQPDLSGRRDSVVDVRADMPSQTNTTAPTPASPNIPSSTSSTPASAPTSSLSSTPSAASTTGTSTATAGRSYASAAASSTNFTIEFSVGNIVVPRDTTIFGSVYKLEQQKLGTTGAPPNVWGQVYTVKYRKVYPEAKEEGVKEEVQTTRNGSADRQMAVKLPFPTMMPEGISLDTSPGKILYLLRLLYGLNSRWAEVYANEDAELDGVHEGGTSALPLQEGSQPMTRVAVTSRTDAPVSIDMLPPAAFANTKLTAKLNRQLDEPLIVASHVLPSWCSSLAKDFSFLVPFETRLVYLQSTSFGYSRSMGRWQQQQQQGNGGSGSGTGRGSADGASHLGRIQRQKVRIARQRILDSMIKVMELYGSTQALLEVEFFDEVGTGLGPTLEFYANVCRDLRKKDGIAFGSGEKIKIWRDDDSLDSQAVKDDNRSTKAGLVPDDYLNPALGFFPAPLTPAEVDTEKGRKILMLYKALGTFVAKALLDSRIVDIPFSAMFLEMVVGEEEEEESAAEAALGTAGRKGAEFHLLRHVDPSLYKSLLDLKKYVHIKRSLEADPTLSPAERAARISNITVKGARLEDLFLDFTLPGYPSAELIPNGKDIALTLDNLEHYIDRVVEMTVGEGVQRQVEAFRRGFDRVFPAADLRSFTVQELAVLVGGAEEEDWAYDVLIDSIKADHGYNSDSRTIKHLATFMSTLNPIQRREFLQFVTGSPKLPLGGFKALNPSLTVVRKNVEAGKKPDDYLPSVMTCVNYLKVPDYSELEVMKMRFEVAVREGQGCFHLS